jgi:hypothetical protein
MFVDPTRDNLAWNDLLLEDYNVIVSELDQATSSESIYQDIIQAITVYNKIPEHLSDLAYTFVLNQRFTSYEYLISILDEPITSNDGITFVEAVQVWGVSGLKVPSSKKFIQFIAESHNCTRLLASVVRQNDLESFFYILARDTRTPKNVIGSYIEALYVALVTSHEGLGSSQILAYLTRRQKPVIKFKGKTMKNLVLRSIEDKYLEVPIPKIGYHMIVAKLYWANSDHRFFFIMVNQFKKFLKKKLNNRLQIKSVTHLFKVIVYILLNRYPELVLTYINRAARYSMFNKIIVGVIRREIEEDSELEADSKLEESNLYLKSIESIALDHLAENPELTPMLIAMLESFNNKVYHKIAGTMYLNYEIRR